MPTYTLDKQFADFDHFEGVEAANWDSAVSQVTGGNYDPNEWLYVETSPLPIFPNYAVQRYVNNGLQELGSAGTLQGAIDLVHEHPEAPWYIVRDTDGLRYNIDERTWGPEFPDDPGVANVVHKAK